MNEKGRIIYNEWSVNEMRLFRMLGKQKRWSPDRSYYGIGQKWFEVNTMLSFFIDEMKLAGPQRWDEYETLSDIKEVLKDMVMDSFEPDFDGLSERDKQWVMMAIDDAGNLSTAHGSEYIYDGSDVKSGLKDVIQELFDVIK